MNEINYQIIEYSNRYKENVEDLLVKLQEFIVSIDSEDVQIVNPKYKSDYLSFVLSNINDNNGALYIATYKQNVIGIIAGYIEPKDEEDKLTNRCPIRGIVTDLFIEEPYRHNGIAKTLFSKIEKFFYSCGCEFVIVNVFAPNKSAFDFYTSIGYTMRNIEMQRRINQFKE